MGEIMQNLIRSVAVAAALSIAVPFAAQAQTPAAAPPKSTAKKPVKNVNETRWASMLASMNTLATEGAEVKRITPAEKKQVDDFIAKTRGQITAAKQGGLSEVEEEQIDGAIADEMVKIAQFMTDDARKKAAPIAKPAAAPAKK
jgi:hypothetical protein